MSKETFNAAKAGITGLHFTIEEGYYLKQMIDQRTEYTTPNEHVCIAGVEVIQSTNIPPQKAFLHPFTLANLLSRQDFNCLIDIHKASSTEALPITPLTPAQQEVIDHIAKTHGF